MILGLISLDQSWLDLAAASAGSLGFEILDMDELRRPLQGLELQELERLWGRDWLLRLVEARLPPLANAVLKSLQTPGEISGMLGLQYRRSMPCRLMSMASGPDLAQAATASGLPWKNWDGSDGSPSPAALKSAIRSLSMGLSRPDWDEYFMRIARVVATRSDCVRRQVAAILVKDRRIIATGYNGTPRGAGNCSEGGCPRCASETPSGTGLDECLCLHGEENAILQAAYHGISVKDAVIYCTMSPCLLCTKKIINSGVSEVVFDSRYPMGDRSLELLTDCGVRVREYRLLRDLWPE